MTKMTDFQRNITAFLPEIEIRLQEPMSSHTSFRIGGPAEAMAFPKNKEELAKILKASALLDCKPVILGAGTNVLAPDAGLSGLEFAHGIPGSVGGGGYMNAGAYGGEICQVCTEVEVMDRQGNISILTNDQMQFSYRHSLLEDTDDIVIRADFRLTKAEPQAIKDRMKELVGKRSASQPLELPSAGSAFKRPVGGYAAALIEQAGLKGFQVGGAAISSKHAGFAVNVGNATAADVKDLLKQVSDKVYEQSGIRLEPEVRIW